MFIGDQIRPEEAPLSIHMEVMGKSARVEAISGATGGRAGVAGVADPLEGPDEPLAGSSRRAFLLRWCVAG